MTGQRRLRAVPAAPGNRAVFYRRVSKVMGRAGEEFISPELQLAAMTGFAISRGLAVVGDPVDDIDESGRGENWARRGGLQRILEMARDGAIDVVVVMKLDRFGRNTAEGLRAYNELRSLGVALYSTVEQIDDTPEGHFMLGQFFGIAQLQSDQIARSWQQVKAHRAAQGLYNASTPPTGYRLVDRRLEPDPRLAPVLRELFRRYAAGEGIAGLAGWWSGLVGHATAYTSLKRNLRNPVYLGKVKHLGQIFDGVHEPLVSERLWRAVQARLDADSRTPSRTLAYVNPFARLAVCDHCDRALHIHRNRRGGWYLLCPGRTRYGICDGVGAPRLEAVEEAVLDELDRRAAGITVDVGAEKARRGARVAAAAVDARRLRRELDVLDAAIARQAADRLLRKVSEQEMEAALGLLRAEREPLAAALRAADAAKVELRPEAAVRLAVEARRRWPRMTAQEKNRTLRAAVRQVRVSRAAYRRQPMGERVEVL